MKYRITIKTFGDGHKEYLPEVRGKIWGWNSISKRFNLYMGYTENVWLKTRGEALLLIDNHYKNHLEDKEMSIEFEYINK